MIQHFSTIAGCGAEVSEIRHHPGRLVGPASQRYLGMVGVPVDPSTRLGLYLTLQGVGRLENELLTQLPTQETPSVLWS
jgi:hypothetical protein